MLYVRACDVHVEFPIFDAHKRSLRHQLGLSRIANALSAVQPGKHKVGGRITTASDGNVSICALNGVDFELHEHDRVALIGQNGSGKTTLLRTIAGMYQPTKGAIEVGGRVTPIFSLSFGMDPESTGLENIWLRGRMLGLGDQLLNSVIEDVAVFSELGEYLDMPIRTYSSGMLARLAFAVSTAVRPEILVLDETIGAVDAAFADRARLRLEALIERTGILVLASHDTQMLRGWCTKGLVVDEGRVAKFGAIDDALACYDVLTA